MKTLVYVSAATNLLARGELDALLNTGCSRNPLAGIKGMLVYCEGSFMQAIEGPAGAVERLFQAIRRDVRHTGVTTILSVEGTQPAFDDWTMAYRRKFAHAPLDEGLACGPCFLDLAPDNRELTDRLNGEAPALRLLRRFLVANRVLSA